MPLRLSSYRRSLFFLLLLFVISSSIYRIDLGFGLFSFKLTPPLFFSIFLYYMFLLEIKREARIKRNILIYLFYYIMLLSIVILISLLVNSISGIITVLQLERFALFFLILTSAWIFLYLFDRLPTLTQYNLLSKFINNALLIYIFFSLIEFYFFYKGKIYNPEENPFLYNFIFLYPKTIGPFLPRLSGGFADPNIAAYFLTFVFFLSLYLGKYRCAYISFLLNLLTISRSGIFGLLFAFLFYKIMNFVFFLYKKKKLRLKIMSFLKKATLIFISFSVVYFLYLHLYDFILLILTVRLSDLETGSGKTHIELISFALKKLNNVFHMLIGYGFNSSWIYAQSFFHTKYANFHSEYITFLFEEGIFGLFIYLFIYLLLFFYGMRNLSKSNLPLISISIAFLLFNVFYQQFLFFYYWIAIFILFYLIDKRKRLRL